MIFDWIKEKLERKAEPFIWTEPESGTQGVGIVHAATETVRILATPAKPVVPAYAPVMCANANAFVSYLTRHASPMETIVFASESGLEAWTDYCDGSTPAATDSTEIATLRPLNPGDAQTKVRMPAQWSPGCASAIAATKAAIGKWISLDAMESLLDVAAPFIKDVLRVRDVLLDLEGAELVGAKRTQTGMSLQIGANVQAKEDRQIPGTLLMAGQFMGQPVTMEIPLRVRVQNRAIQFLLVDNGAMKSAELEAVTLAAQFVQAAGWFTVQGSRN